MGIGQPLATAYFWDKEIARAACQRPGGSMADIIGYNREEKSAQPSSLYMPYKSTEFRAPKKPLVILPHTLSEVTGPVYGHGKVLPIEADLTKQHAGEPLGERIIVSGKLLDENGRAVPNTLIEVWQCNA